MTKSVFNDTERKDVATSFGLAAQRYDLFALAQKQIAAAARLRAIELIHPQTCSKIVDIGCGTGAETVQLVPLTKSVVGVDISAGMIRFAQDKYVQNKNVVWKEGDAEDLPLADGSVDFVFSSMALQWLGTPFKLVSQCQRVMKTGAKGILAVLTDGAMHELSNVFSEFGLEKKINQFPVPQEWLAAFEGEGFTVTAQSKDFITWHDSIFSLLHSIKDVGAGCVRSQIGQQTLSKSLLRDIERIYRDRYGECRKLPLTYRVTFFEIQKKQEEQS